MAQGRSAPSTWEYNTTADEVAAALADQIIGKTVLITGVSPSTLGAEAAAAIATQRPKLLILASRNLEKVQQTIEYIKDKAPEAATRPLKLDLADLSSVRAAAAEVNAYPEQIDVLINNAALMATPYWTTADGFEAQFGTGHLGHFLFTNLILGKIPQQGRIVNVSSTGHRLGPVRWDDPGFQNGKIYDKWVAYGQVKTANVLFSIALAERGRNAFSLHPGEIASTNLGSNLPPEELEHLMVIHSVTKTVQQGTATHLVAAFRPDLIPEHNGAYLVDCQVSNADLAEHATGKENADRLWKLSEEMVGQKFEL